MTAPLPEPEHPSPPAPRLPALDALRGIAIVLVLLYHFAPSRLVVSPPARAALSVLQVGWVGVDLFFVLSGFLITGILLDGRGDRQLLPRFYARRALRLLPLYYGTLLVLLVVALVVRRADAASQSSAAFLEHQWWYWLHAANVLAAQHTQWAGESWVQHFWSLAVEEQFYLLWPPVVLLLPARWLPRAIGAILVGALALRIWLAVVLDQPVAAFVLMPARADSLAVGALLAVAWRTPAWHTQLTRIAMVAVPVLGVALVELVVQGPSGGGLLISTVGHTYWALFFGALLWLGVAPAAPHDDVPYAVVAHWKSWLGRQRWLHVFARYSYGLYVVHVPLREWLVSRGLGGADLIARHGEWIGSTAGLAIGVLLSFAVAVPLWHLFEAPILARGGARLDAWLRGRRAAATPALAALPAPIAPVTAT